MTYIQTNDNQSIDRRIINKEIKKNNIAILGLNERGCCEHIYSETQNYLSINKLHNSITPYHMTPSPAKINK